MPSVLLIAVTIVAGYFSSFIYRFIRNYLNARKTGFPSVIVPWDQNHFLWMLTSVPLRPWLQRRLPKFVYDRIVLCIYGWEFHERLRPFEEYSAPRGNEKSYMLVGCGKGEFWTRDPEIGNQILTRPRDFTQLDITDLFMAKFGHNVLTSNGDRWARQRKIVASVINERISKAVFNESVTQTEGLIAEVFANVSGDEANTNKLFDMAKKITIHVLSGAGMGASIPWHDEGIETPKPGFKQTYIQSVKTIIRNITGPLILPQWLLSIYPSFLPGYKTAESLSNALQEFPTHTTEMLEQERQRTKASHSEARSNIMSQLLQASESGSDIDANGETSEKKKALSDEEMMGNLFVFTAAGFDTTANSISYALVLLARYPRWQEWLLEEIDEIAPTNSDVELDYVDTFPKATRLMAFMLETLRIFTPLIHIAKQTRTPQTIHTSSETFWLPADATVYINAISLHADPEVWHALNAAPGEKIPDDDVWQFRPTRWISPPGSPQPLFQPPKGAYIPWSAGPRICPGQKMAQVEFVAIFLTLLRRHRIEAVPLQRADGGDETRAEVDKRLDARMRNSISILTLQMNDVYDVSDSGDGGLMLKLSKR